jgi:hypothetical protein
VRVFGDYLGGLLLPFVMLALDGSRGDFGHFCVVVRPAAS